jgi:two-component system, chemotaxis family, response regulator Rcp1
VLLVEDNPADARLTAEALKEGNVHSVLRVVADGVEALAYLRREAPYRGAARPDIILLDLNLPRKSGREVLAEIKADPVLKAIPVVVLTTSQADTDVAQCYALHANCYVVKPVEFEAFVRVVHNFRAFWLNSVVLPPKGDAAR